MSANVRGDGVGTAPDGAPRADDWTGWRNWGIQLANSVRYLLRVCKLLYDSSTQQLTFINDAGTLPLIRSDLWDDSEYFVKLAQTNAKGGTLAIISAGAPAGVMLERGNGTYVTPTALLSGDPLGFYAMGGYDGTAWLNGVGGIIMVAAENWTGAASGSYLMLSTQEPASHRATTPPFTRLYIRRGVEIAAFNGSEPTGGDKGAGTLNVATGYYVNGSKGASYQVLPTNPTGTTNTTGKMMGLAGAITPKTTGLIVFTITGYGTNDTINDGFTAAIRYGTGAAPANGDALTGTVVGSTVIGTMAAAFQALPFSVTGAVGGLSVNTAYWIDLGVAAFTGGTASVNNVSITAFELTV